MKTITGDTFAVEKRAGKAVVTRSDDGEYLGFEREDGVYRPRSRVAVEVTDAGRIFTTETPMPGWYAPGVGVVKQVFRPSRTNIVIERTRYTPEG